MEEKTLEQQIKDQEDKVAKIKQSDMVVYDYLVEYSKLLELKLKLAESNIAEKDKEILTDDVLLASHNKLLEEIPECSIHGDHCIPSAIEWVKKAKEAMCKIENLRKTDKPKEKTFVDYLKEYCSIKHMGFTAKFYEPDNFEFCCGLLRYICKEVDKGLGKVSEELMHSIVWNKTTNKYMPYNADNPFSASYPACEKVIRICGTEFLDKIFKG